MLCHPWRSAGLTGVSFESALKRIDRDKDRAYWRGRHAEKPQLRKIAPSRARETPRTDLAADQLKAMMKANFRPRALLNTPEARLLDLLVIERNPNWQGMAQVSFGGIHRQRGCGSPPQLVDA